MNKKKFFIVTTVVFICILIIGTLVIKYSQSGIMDFGYSGFPLKYYWSSSECLVAPCSGFSVLSLIIDLVIWSLVSIGITSLILRNKK